MAYPMNPPNLAKIAYDGCKTKFQQDTGPFEALIDEQKAKWNAAAQAVAAAVREFDRPKFGPETMESTSLGKIVYDACRGRLIRERFHDFYGSFDELEDNAKQAWQFAAETVVKVVSDYDRGLDEARCAKYGKNNPSQELTAAPQGEK